MELNIVSPGGAQGTVSVSEVAFGREFNQDLVHQAVVANWLCLVVVVAVVV